MPRILILDDDRDTLEHFARILRLEGFLVDTAVDIKTALEYVKQHPLDAMLVDLRLSSEDGLSFLRQIRADQPTAPVPAALITGDYFVDESVEAEAKMLDVRLVFKPIWIDQLVAVVREMVAG